MFFSVSWISGRFNVAFRLETGVFSQKKRQQERKSDMKIKALPEEERPMEKGLYLGMEQLSNAELIALLLNSGTKEKSAIAVAEEILSLGAGISGLRDLSAQELMHVAGVGKGKAARILAALELGKRIAARPEGRPVNVNSPDDIAGLFMEELRGLKKETFRALFLNAKGDIISAETISVGELTSTLVHPREVFHAAVKKSAAAVVFIHNHPSGDPSPSREDIETTRRLTDCGRLLGIRVLDHLIIGDGRYVSMQASGAVDF